MHYLCIAISLKHRADCAWLSTLQSDEDEDASENGVLGDGEQSDTNDSTTGAEDGPTEADDEGEPSPAPSERAQPQPAALQHAGVPQKCSLKPAACYGSVEQAQCMQDGKRRRRRMRSPLAAARARGCPCSTSAWTTSTACWARSPRTSSSTRRGTSTGSSCGCGLLLSAGNTVRLHAGCPYH